MRRAIKITAILCSVLLIICTFTVSTLAVDTEETLIDTDTVWKYLDNNTDPAADLNSLTATYMTEDNAFCDVVLCVGSDETQRQITWYSTLASSSTIYCAPIAEVTNGEFPDGTAHSSEVAVATNKSGYYSHKATLTNLEPDTDYVYCMSVGDNSSELYYFSTDPVGDYEFTFVGDPQLNSAEGSAAWADTLATIKSELGTSLLVSAGDQIVTPASEEHYGYLLLDELTGFTFAPTIGPAHDSPSVAFYEHFNLPNVSTEYGVDVSGANYWYTYNNTLFMHLNMADTAAATNNEHKAFMEQAIAANPGTAWKIVVLHNALFSAGYHSWEEYAHFETEIGVFRAALAPILTELEIDVVLSGHDHIYVRSRMMDGVTPSTDEVVGSFVSDPIGTLHICASSSTGTKFYDCYVTDANYIAYKNDEHRKSAIHFSVTDTEITMTSYFLDDMSVFDTFTVSKTAHIHTLERVEPHEPTCINGGNAEYWKCTSCNLFFADFDCTVETAPYEQVTAPLGHDLAPATCTEPKTCKREGCDYVRGRAGGHEYSDPTCTEPAVCEICSATDGEPRGHKYSGDCDSECNRAGCSQAREPGEHVDANGDKLCDVCSAEMKSGSIAVIAVSAALAVAVAVAVVIIIVIRKKKADI